MRHYEINQSLKSIIFEIEALQTCFKSESEEYQNLKFALIKVKEILNGKDKEHSIGYKATMFIEQENVVTARQKGMFIN